MKIFTCTDHKGRYVGTASVIVAEDEAQARTLLQAALDAKNLGQNGPDDFTLQELDTYFAHAIILQDGDY